MTQTENPAPPRATLPSLLQRYTRLVAVSALFVGALIGLSVAHTLYGADPILPVPASFVVLALGVCVALIGAAFVTQLVFIHRILNAADAASASEGDHDDNNTSA